MLRVKKPLMISFGLLAAAFLFGILLIAFAPHDKGGKPADGLVSTGTGPVPVGPNAPKEVSLIRHAEEPKSGPDLSPEGTARANALVGLFQHPITFPSAIFAAKTSKQSARPVQTCEPLAKAVGVTINSEFDEQEYKRLATAILQSNGPAGGIIVVCWKRETMPHLARALGVADAPAEWPSEQYDHIWRITYTNGKATLKDETQDIKLPGSPGAVK
jgi:hypothetical protein